MNYQVDYIQLQEAFINRLKGNEYAGDVNKLSELLLYSMYDVIAKRESIGTPMPYMQELRIEVDEKSIRFK